LVESPIQVYARCFMTDWVHYTDSNFAVVSLMADDKPF
jgi:hypothetical protein